MDRMMGNRIEGQKTHKKTVEKLDEREPTMLRIELKDAPAEKTTHIEDDNGFDIKYRTFEPQPEFSPPFSV